jgi:hypothetical protein
MHAREEKRQSLCMSSGELYGVQGMSVFIFTDLLYSLDSLFLFIVPYVTLLLITIGQCSEDG